ncbi:MAG TPA: hypothetical protein VIG97_10920 [Luteimonas sp.]
MKTKWMLALVLAGCIAGPAVAGHAPVNAQKGDFAAERARVNAVLNDGETYVELNTGHRKEVNDLLDSMQQQLAGRRFTELDESARKQVLESQGRVNAILEQAARDSRQVCRRERAVGSNFRELQCMTAAERTRQRKGGRDGWEQATRRGQGPTQVLGN